MNEFNTENLDKMKEELRSRFPMPREFAMTDKGIAQKILDRMKAETTAFSELSITDLSFAYQLAGACDKREYAALKTAFRARMTQMLFDIGWIFFQWNPDDEAARPLFSIACEWMEANKPDEFKESILGLAENDLHNIYEVSSEHMLKEELNINDFCQKYRLDLHSPFYENLRYAYVCICEKDELLENAELIVSLLASAEVDKLKPLLRNYVAKVQYEEMPLNINDAIFDRLVKEGGTETLGLSQSVLQQIRSLRFVAILKECVNGKTEKLDFYSSVAAHIRQVELLPQSYFSIDFGHYVVMDNTNWNDKAYAYTPQIFARLLDGWKAVDVPDNYWPAMNEDEITTARELVLNLKKANVVELGFESFDRLYSKDVLSISRYG